MEHPKQGTKFDSAKPRMELISPEALEEMAKVLTFGAEKYGDYNWSQGIKFTRVIAAILRHTYSFLRGETIDPESGINHMAHVMCNCMFLIHFNKYKKEYDDRPSIYGEKQDGFRSVKGGEQNIKESSTQSPTRTEADAQIREVTAGVMGHIERSGVYSGYSE